MNAARNTIKTSSQSGYINNVVDYFYWCTSHHVSPLQFPIDHFQIASYLLDHIYRGLASSTIRGKKAAISWFYNIFQSSNSKSVKLEGMFDNDHPAFITIAKYASRRPINIKSYAAIAIKRQYIIKLYSKFTIKIDDNYIFFTILIISIVTGSRIHMLIPYHPLISSIKQGITSQGLKFIFKDHNLTKYINDKYLIQIPKKYYYKIQALQMSWVHSKTTQSGYEFHKYIGKTNKNIDPLNLIIRLIQYYKEEHIDISDDQFFFKNTKGKTITYHMYAKWLSSARLQLSNELGDNIKKIKTHSGRKTFVTILEKVGYSAQRISKYTGWKDHSTMMAYLSIDPQEMCQVTKDIFYEPFVYD